MAPRKKSAHVQKRNISMRLTDQCTKCPKDFIVSSDRSFSNDDGSSRQEVGAPDAIRGSYSFVSPEGEEVQVWQSS